MAKRRGVSIADVIQDRVEDEKRLRQIERLKAKGPSSGGGSD